MLTVVIVLCQSYSLLVDVKLMTGDVADDVTSVFASAKSMKSFDYVTTLISFNPK